MLSRLGASVSLCLVAPQPRVKTRPVLQKASSLGLHRAGVERGTVMSYSSAGVQSQAPPTQTPPTQVSWTIATLMVLLALVVSALVYLVAQQLDDRSSSGATTTARTSTVPGPVASLAGTDLGGSIHRRSGNQP